MALLANVAGGASVPAWLNGPAWHREDDGDTLHGLDAIAAYLDLPFLRVRELQKLGYIPTRRKGRAIIGSRAALSAHFDQLERAATGGRFMASEVTPIGGDLVRLDSGIAAHMRITRGAVRHHREQHGLPAFRVGKVIYARRSSLDRWKVAEGHKSGWDRRRERLEGRQ